MNPRGMTPMTVVGMPLTLIDCPAMFGSLAKRDDQIS